MRIEYIGIHPEDVVLYRGLTCGFTAAKAMFVAV
jgi:hypothetical protein